jgi:hypothetical protein
MLTSVHSSRAQELAAAQKPSALLDSLSTSPSTYLISAAQGQGSNSQPVAGPVRMARVSFLQGNVRWRPSNGLDRFRDNDDVKALNVSATNQDNDASDTPSWTHLTLNLPVQEGAAVQVARNARLELQFDEGSFLRLGSDTQVTLRAMHSDKDGAFTEIILEQGVASLHLRHQYSAFRVVTPLAAVGAIGPVKLRVGVTPSGRSGASNEVLPNTEFAVRAGQATVDARQGDIVLEAGDHLALSDKRSPFRVARLPVADEWERWNDTRDRRFAGRLRPAIRHLPPNIALVASDLDHYGTWRQDSRYGYVWCPRVATGWRPYSAGRWVNIQPWGWTWVSTEAWGWAPYHYGTWTSTQWGWAWVPGPAKQPWSPAVVSLSQNSGIITWVPLSPDEVRYPTTLSSGFTINRWDTYFSVPVVAAYCPAPAPPYTTHYSTNYYSDLYIAQPCYSYWGTPVIKTVNIYKGPVTIINKRRGGYPYPGRVKNIYKGPVTIINPLPKNNGKSPGQSAGHNSGKPGRKNSAAVVPVNVQRGGASSAPAGEFGKGFSHRRATASDVVQLSRKKLSLLSLRQDTSIVPQAVTPTATPFERAKQKERPEQGTRSDREFTTITAPGTRGRRTDTISDVQAKQPRKHNSQRPIYTPQDTTEDTADKQRSHQGRAEVKRGKRGIGEEPSKQENQDQERAIRHEQKEEPRETRQQAENQRREQREERERTERQERQQRAQREQQQREEQERNERQAREGREQQRQENERRQQEGHNRRRAEQQEPPPAAPAGNDADRTPGNGRRRDR